MPPLVCLNLAGITPRSATYMNVRPPDGCGMNFYVFIKLLRPDVTNMRQNITPGFPHTAFSIHRVDAHTCNMHYTSLFKLSLRHFPLSDRCKKEFTGNARE